MWLAIAKEKETVSVTRGENRGRNLSYHHPVRELSPVGMWKGEAMTLRLPLKDLKTMGGDCLIAMRPGRELGPRAWRRRVRGRRKRQLIAESRTVRPSPKNKRAGKPTRLKVPRELNGPVREKTPGGLGG